MNISLKVFSLGVKRIKLIIALAMTLSVKMELMMITIFNQIIKEYEEEEFLDFIPSISEKEQASQKILIVVAMLDTDSALSLTY